MKKLVHSLFLAFLAVCFSQAPLLGFSQALGLASDSVGSTVPFSGPKVFLFPIGQSVLSRAYASNGAMFNALDSLMSRREVYSDIDSVLITAAASPIGSEQLNERLALQRGDAMRRYLLVSYPGFPVSRISVTASGIDWEGFEALVQAREDFPHRTTILSWLHARVSPDAVLARLRGFDAATTHYLLTEIYPRLQYASVRLRLKDGRFIHASAGSPLRLLLEQSPSYAREAVTLYDTVRVTVFDTVRVGALEALEAFKTFESESFSEFSADERPAGRSLTLGIGSNLLYDAGLLPHLSLTLSAWSRWSLMLEGAWSWWSTTDSKRQFHRIQLAGAEVRYRFGDPDPNRALAGWFAGAYAMGGTYDVRFGSRGYLSNWSYSAGLTGGYIRPLTRHLRLEWFLGLGVLDGICHDYTYDAYWDDYPQTGVRRLRYFGPTKAGVSLVYTFKLKGGRR